MSELPIQSSKHVLDPSDRISEVLFGLIMVLTFTGSLSVANAGRDDVRVMLIGALGCNIAWGVIDGILYLMGNLAENGRNLRIYREVRRSTDSRQACRLIADALPALVSSVLQPSELETLHNRLRELPEPPEKVRLQKDDWQGAVGVFSLVILSTLPVALPFVFMDRVLSAMRVSNGIAILMLFGAGFSYARIVGRNPWLVGLGMVVLGGILVAMTIVLGG